VIRSIEQFIAAVRDGSAEWPGGATEAVPRIASCGNHLGAYSESAEPQILEQR